MSRLKDKLNNYEVVPPANAWDKIAAALDESESGTEFPSRLYNMEQAPPFSAWENIHSSLAGPETPVIPFRKGNSSILRYAIAAVLIGIIAFAVFKFSGRTPGTLKNDSSQVAGIQKNQKASEKNNTPVVPDRVNTYPAEQAVTPDENKNQLAQVEQPVRIRDRKTTSRIVSNASYNYSDPSTEPVNPLYAYEDHVMPNLADRYIMLMTPEGNIIRMSKKLGNLVCCVSGEEQDPDCKSQLKKWQEKLAASPTASSPGNFLDILNLVNSLDDNGTEL